MAGFNPVVSNPDRLPSATLSGFRNGMGKTQTRHRPTKEDMAGFELVAGGHGGV